MARYALVVGISFYSDEHFEPLDKADTDAEAVAKILSQDKRYKVAPPLIGEVTGAKLGEELCRFLNEKAVKNEALIYFTGHGFKVVDNLGMTQGYLATSDCEVTINNGLVTEQKNGLSLNSLSALIQNSDLSNLVVMLDACHSGELLEKTLIQKSLTEFGKRTDYILITGCRSAEQGVAKKRADHSVFTGALLEGLSPENASGGEVTAGSVYESISRKLRNETQEPIYMGVGRSIVLLEYPSSKKAVEPIRDENGQEVCPYQGLKAFEANQKEFFFGRKRLIEKLKQTLDQTPFVPVIGASGSGKSSVVRAGLIPWLNESENWEILETIKPGMEPLNELRGAFKPYFKTNKDQQRLKLMVEDGAAYPQGLAEIVQQLPSSQRFLLVVDQFEEVFTVCSDSSHGERFIQLITQVTELSPPRLAVVITMRADFLEPCLHHNALFRQIQTHAVYMPPLQGADLEEAIIAPAERQGYSVEPALVDEIQDEVGKEPGILPLLQFALTMLWEKRDRLKQQLGLEQYKQLRGLRGALNQHADKVYNYRDFDQDEPSQERSQKERDWIKQTFLELVRIGEQEKDTRQRRQKTDLLQLGGTDAAEERQELLEGEQGLVQGRLLVTSGQEAKAEAGWVDLVHEALLEGWQQFAQWRQENRDQRRLIQRMKDVEQEWHEKGQKNEYLLQGGLLAEVREQWLLLQPLLGTPEQEFYGRSDLYEQDRITKLERLVAESQLREGALRIANSWTVTKLLKNVMRAIAELGENREKLPDKLLAPVQTNLHRGYQEVRQSKVICWHDEADVNSVAFSPDGQMIVSGSRDSTVRLWDLQGNAIGQPFQHESEVRSVAFSPDGQMIVSGSYDSAVMSWLVSSMAGHVLSLAECYRAHPKVS